MDVHHLDGEQGPPRCAGAVGTTPDAARFHRYMRAEEQSS
jgi:hypothetical protein